MTKLYSNKAHKGQARGIAHLLGAIRTETGGVDAVMSKSVGHAGSAVAMESLDPTITADLRVTLEHLSGNLFAGFKEAMGGELTVAQEEAAIGGAMFSGSAADKFIRATRYSDEQYKSSGVIGGEGPVTIAVPALGIADAQARRSMAFEAYDQKQNTEVGTYSAAFNGAAARQVEAGELLYPTVVVAPNQQGYNVNVRMLYAMDAVTRDVSGALSTFNRKNVVKALIDKSILATDQTKLIPVHRTASAANFVAGVTPVDIVTADGETVKTAPLAIGKKFSLLGVSQTEAQLAAGAQNQTDAVDTARLTAVILKLVDGGTTEFVRFDVGSLPTADFNAAVQGNTQRLQLNFSTSSLLVSAATKTLAGTVASLLGPLGANTARLSVTLAGSVIRDLGDTEMMAGAVSVTSVNDDQGNVISTASGAGATQKALLEGATVVGYELLAFRSNSNKRSLGKLLDSQEINFLYNVPLLPPLAQARPTMGSSDHDSQMLADLVAVTRLQTAGAMVTELLRARDVLQAYAGSGDADTSNPQVFGPASLMVDPVFVQAALDVATAIDSRSTAERIEDLRALLVNKVRDAATKMFIDSGYGPALEAVYPGQNKKPLVIAACDPELANYLQIVGDTRIVGDMFDFKFAPVYDSRMKGKIIFSFGIAEAEGAGAPTVLHLGNMAWRAEITAILPATRQGAQSMELTVQPSYRFVTNLPIMGEITVTNLGAVVAGKVALNMHTV